MSITEDGTAVAGAASTAEEVAAAPSTGAAEGVKAQSGQAQVMYAQVMYITHAAKTKARQWWGLHPRLKRLRRHHQQGLQMVSKRKVGKRK